MKAYNNVLIESEPIVAVEKLNIVGLDILDQVSFFVKLSCFKKLSLSHWLVV